MAGREEVSALIDRIGSIAYAQRVVPAEEAIAQADALADEDLMAAARIELVTAYLYSTNKARMFVPFTWLLKRYDDRPDWFGEYERHKVLWFYKWMIATLVEYPQVPRDQLEATLAGMERRYTDGGEGLAPVLMCRYVLRAHIDSEAAAQAEFAAWVDAPRTPLSDCQACEPSQRSAHFAALGEHERAVAEVESVLTGQVRCAEQPQWAISEVLPSLLVTGRGPRAAAEHRRGARISRQNPDEMGTIAAHVLVCARSQQLARGLDLLVERLPDLDDPPTPWTALRLAAAGARLLSGLTAAGYAELPVVVAGRSTSVHELGIELTAFARLWGRRFDERNGTGTVGARVDEWLTATELAPLELGAAGVALADRAGLDRTPAAATADPLPAGATQLDPSALLVLRHETQRVGTEPAVGALARLWLETGGRNVRAEHMRAAGGLDAELLRFQLEEQLRAGRAPRTDEHLLARAVGRLQVAGAPAEAALVELLDALAAGDLSRAAGLIGEVDTHTEDVELRSRARLRAAAIAAQLHDLSGNPDRLDDARRWRAQALELLTTVGADSSSELRLAAALAWSAGLSGTEDDGAARALALLGVDEHRGLRSDLHVRIGQELAGQESFDEAETQLRAAIADAVAVDSTSAEGTARLRLGQLLLHLDRAEDAHRELAEAVRQYDRMVDPVSGALARLAYAEARHGAGDPLEAAETAEAGILAVGLALASVGEVETVTFVERKLRLRRLHTIRLHLYRIAAEVSEELGERPRVVHQADLALADVEVLLADLAARAFPPPAAAAHLRAIRAEMLLARAGALAEIDAVRAVAAFDDALDAAASSELHRLVAVALRQRAWAVHDADGLDAGLAAVDQALAGQAALEARHLGDADFAEQLGPWSFDGERLTLQNIRARMLASAGENSRALDALAGLADGWRALDAEVPALHAGILHGLLLLRLDRDVEGSDVLVATSVRARELGMGGLAQDAAATLSNWLDAQGRADEAEAIWWHFNPAG